MEKIKEKIIEAKEEIEERMDKIGKRVEELGEGLAEKEEEKTRDVLFGKPFEPSSVDKCIFDERIFSEVTKFLRTRKEFGGCLIGEYTNGNTVNVYAAAFPPQTKHSPTFCEFQSSYLVPIITSLEESGLASYGPVAWVHSHPNLGFFLSPIDKETFGFLLRQNPKLLAVVVDPFTEEKAVAFANKSTGFEPTKIDLEIRPLSLIADYTFALNMLRTKLREGLIITPHHKFSGLVDSICSLRERTEKIGDKIGILEQQVNYLMTQGIKRIDSLESLVHPKYCPKCKIRYSPRKKYCPRCGTKLQ